MEKYVGTGTTVSFLLLPEPSLKRQLTFDTVNLTSVTSFLEEITYDHTCVKRPMFDVDSTDLREEEGDC